jgi:hypothetical protein
VFISHAQCVSAGPDTCHGLQYLGRHATLPACAVSATFVSLPWLLTSALLLPIICALPLSLHISMMMQDDFRCGGINSTNVMKVADAMVRYGLDKVGYTYRLRCSVQHDSRVRLD